MSQKQYASSAQMRGYQVLKQLFGHEINGIACHELAAQLNKPKVTVYKDLKGLEAAGLAEQLPDKNWRLSSALAREAVSAFNRLLNEKILIDINSPRECVIGERILLEENYMLLKENRMFYECVAEITKIIKPNRIQIKMIRQLFH